MKHERGRHARFYPGEHKVKRPMRFESASAFLFSAFAVYSFAGGYSLQSRR